MEHETSRHIEGQSTLAIFSFVAGVLSLLMLVASLQPLPETPVEQLAFVANHRTVYAWFVVIVLSWAVFSIPYVVTLGTVLRPRGRTLTQSATILSAVGILLLAFGIFLNAGALLSIVAAGHPPRSDDAAYQAAIWGSLRFYLTDPGLMAWGLGQFMFGWAAWRSGVLPNWLAVLGMIGGLAGLLTLAVYQSGALALVQIAIFTIWGFGTGIVLLRSRTS